MPFSDLEYFVLKCSKTSYKEVFTFSTSEFQFLSYDQSMNKMLNAQFFDSLIGNHQVLCYCVSQ